MAYTDVISLNEAKTYLGVDDTSRDAEITRMIKAALSYVEKYTNVIMYARDIEYNYTGFCVRVYDFPINTDTVADSVVVTKKSLYTLYQETDLNNDSITLNVGYADPLDIHPDLIEAACMLIEHYFGSKEGDKTKIPYSVTQILDFNKRFIL